MARTSRRRLIVEPGVQLGLVLRIVTYWLFSLLAIGLILLVWDIGQGPLGPFFSAARFSILWDQYAALVIASIFVLPVMLADSLIVSNRFAGPLYRVRNRMRALAAGQSVDHVKLRDNDYCVGLANDFNAVVDYVARLRDEITRLQDKSPVGASGTYPQEADFEVETSAAR